MILLIVMVSVEQLHSQQVQITKDQLIALTPLWTGERFPSEIVRLRDMFGHQRLKEGKYTAGQIDSRWSDEIEKDFSKWLHDHINELPVPKEQIQKYLKDRTW
jgi:hypothetical protein